MSEACHTCEQADDANWNGVMKVTECEQDAVYDFALDMERNR